MMFFHFIDTSEQLLRPVLWCAFFFSGLYGFMLQMSWLVGRPTKKNALRHWLLCSFICLITGGFEVFTYFYTQSCASEEVHELFKEPIVSILADEKTVTSPTSLINSLNNISKSRELQPSHTRTILLKIKNVNKEWPLILKRDAQNTDKYWVYYRFPDSSRDNYIGLIVTPELNQY